jgi:hypothetical protein
LWREDAASAYEILERREEFGGNRLVLDEEPPVLR